MVESRFGFLMGRAGPWLATCMLLSACAAMPEDWRDYGAGWRSGYVLETGSPAAIGGRFDSDCRNDAALRPDDAKRRFAVVLYGTHGGVIKERVAPLDAQSTVARGDRVEVNIERCVTVIPLSGQAQGRPNS